MKFYYSAISTSAKKKLMGSISAESEKEARKKLNKMGMAILSIGAEKPDDWGKTSERRKVFEFAAINKIGTEICGEIFTENSDDVFDLLTEELKFKKINYICNSAASEEEKIKARESSVREIMSRKQKEEERKADEEMRTFSGSLKALVKMQITKKEEDEKEDLSEKNPTKFSNNNKENIAITPPPVLPKFRKNSRDAMLSTIFLLLSRTTAV